MQEVYERLDDFMEMLFSSGFENTHFDQESDIFDEDFNSIGFSFFEAQQLNIEIVVFDLENSTEPLNDLIHSNIEIYFSIYNDDYLASRFITFEELLSCIRTFPKIYKEFLFFFDFLIRFST